MSTVNYPAVFHQEGKKYWVEFPDLKGCFSDGKTLEEAFENSKEALGMYLDKEGEKYKRVIKEPSDINKIIKEFKNETVMFVEYNSLEYARKYKNKAVKKTLSIPEWLNEIAMSESINFSQALQEALLQKLKLK